MLVGVVVTSYWSALADDGASWRDGQCRPGDGRGGARRGVRVCCFSVRVWIRNGLQRQMEM